LADEFQLTIEVSHFPPGTSKWNKIEHRMFCHITADSRGQPLTSREAVVNLIGSTTTNQELRIKATLDENTHPARIKVSDEELATVAIEHNDFHGEWNYRLRPRNQHAQIELFRLLFLDSQVRPPCYSQLAQVANTMEFHSKLRRGKAA